MIKRTLILMLAAIPFLANAGGRVVDDIDAMVKKYDKDNSYGDDYKTENNFIFVDSNNFMDEGFSIKGAKKGGIGGNALTRISEIKQKKDDVIKSLYYTAEVGNGIVGYDSVRNLGVIDYLNSDFPIVKDSYDFGVKMVGTRCYTFYNVLKNDESLIELNKIDKYQVSGVTEYLDVRDIVNGGSYYGFYNNVSCSFFDTFKVAPSISRSINFKYLDDEALSENIKTKEGDKTDEN